MAGPSFVDNVLRPVYRYFHQNGIAQLETDANRVSRTGIHALCLFVALFYMPYPTTFVLGAFIGFISPQSIQTAFSRMRKIIVITPLALIGPCLVIALIFYKIIIAAATFYAAGFIAARFAYEVLEQE